METFIIVKKLPRAFDVSRAMKEVMAKPAIKSYKISLIF